MDLDKTPCKGIYRISCSSDSCNSGKDRISPDCIGCPSSMIEIIDHDDKVLNTIPAMVKEEEKSKSAISQVAEIQVAETQATELALP